PDRFPGAAGSRPAEAAGPFRPSVRISAAARRANRFPGPSSPAGYRPVPATGRISAALPATIFQHAAVGAAPPPARLVSQSSAEHPATGSAETGDPVRANGSFRADGPDPTRPTIRKPIPQHEPLLPALNKKRDPIRVPRKSTKRKGAIFAKRPLPRGAKSLPSPKTKASGPDLGSLLFSSVALYAFKCCSITCSSRRSTFSLPNRDRVWFRSGQWVCPVTPAPIGINSCLPLNTVYFWTAFSIFLMFAGWKSASIVAATFSRKAGKTVGTEGWFNTSLASASGWTSSRKNSSANRGSSLRWERDG